MKIIITIACLLFSLYATAQNPLPVIKANSKSAKIFEQGNSVSGWGIDPKAGLDIYTTNKFRNSKSIKFKTDIDSITFKIKPGQKKDFIVLLNGKDSCFTRIEARINKDFSQIQPVVNDSIPFFVNQYNTNLVKVVFNKIDTLQMNFDSGATEMSLTRDVLAKKVKSSPKLYNTFYDVKIGSRIYKSKIYDNQNVGHEADGLLGWDLFDGMIVELNYDRNLMVIHSKMPKRISNDQYFFKSDIRYINDRPFIEARIKQNGVTHKNWFLFDLGYQRTVMLDNDILSKSKFPTDKMNVIKKVILKGTQNNEIPLITADLENLQIGPFRLNSVPAQLLSQNKPMRGINIHILGNEVLKRFNTFFDFQKDVIYLKPNDSYQLGYIDGKKS